MARGIGCGLSIAGILLLPPLMMAGLIGWADMAVAGSDQAPIALAVLIGSIVLWFVCVGSLLRLAWMDGQRRAASRKRPPAWISTGALCDRVTPGQGFLGGRALTA